MALLALAAFALVPAATADLYGKSIDGVYSAPLAAGGLCDMTECINTRECVPSTRLVRCITIGNVCGNNGCEVGGPGGGTGLF